MDDKAGKIKEVAAYFKAKGAEVDSLDGITCQYPDWWLNLRASNTEPLLRLTMEARDATLLKEKLALVQGMLGEPVEH